MNNYRIKVSVAHIFFKANCSSHIKLTIVAIASVVTKLSSYMNIVKESKEEKLKNGSRQTLVTNERDGWGHGQGKSWRLTRRWGNLCTFRIRSILAASNLASKLRRKMLQILIGANTWSCVWSHCITTPSVSSYLIRIHDYPEQRHLRSPLPAPAAMNLRPFPTTGP